MAPITRVALIGLSSSAKTAWASKAHLPYLLSPRGKAHYEIVALLNSSVSAARAAIAAYNLPSTTRAYGDPAQLAADAEVDLVVCCTRVDTHYDAVKASVDAGKDVFVEWPLAQDAAHARLLAEAAEKAGGRSVVGIQGHKAPFASKLREVLEEGRIGKVVSSELRMFGALGDREKVPEGLGYFTERAVGGNIFTIGFAHVFHLVQAILGEFGSLKGDFHLQRPEVPLYDPSSGAVVKTVRSDVPDLILVQGRWEESNIAQQNAPLHYRLRRGQPFHGEPALVWTINGEKGEIRLISQQSTFIAVGDAESSRYFEVHDFQTDKLEKVAWDWEDWQQELPIPARNIAALYEAFLDTKENGAKPTYATFADSTKRHEQLESLIAGWKP